MVDAVKEVLGPADALVVHPWGNWAIGYYGPWPVTLVKVSDSTNGFFVHPARDHTLVLAESYEGRSFRDPVAIESQLSKLMSEPFSRIVYFGDHGHWPEHQAIARAIARYGYVVTRQESRPTGTGRALAVLIVLDRADSVPTEQRNPTR